MKKITLAQYSFIVLLYNIAVIVYGAFVRATGSGAGCGSHWPLCNGVIIPRPERVETMIEFTHRVMSGLTLVLILILILWIWRTYPRGHALRRSGGFVGFFIITESLLGAGLVLFGLVEDDASLARAISMMAHLVNTFLLMASLTITTWWLHKGVNKGSRTDLMTRVAISAGAIGLLILGASGAITALGDTLFPANSFAEGLRQDMDPGAHFLIRLRVFHPVIAVLAGAYVTGLGYWLRRKFANPILIKGSFTLTVLFGLQLFLGLLNVILAAPVWMQLIHLTVTTVIWCNFVLISLLVWNATEEKQYS